MTKRVEYHRLKVAMYSSQYSLLEIAKTINCTAATLARRLKGESPFTLDEVYGICALLEIPVSDIPTLFPNRKANEVKLK